MGEHQDAEKELDPAAPIASLSLGQPRDFVFKHRDARRPRPHKRDIPTGASRSQGRGPGQPGHKTKAEKTVVFNVSLKPISNKERISCKKMLVGDLCKIVMEGRKLVLGRGLKITSNIFKAY